MKERTHAEIQEIDKERWVNSLTEELPALRAKAGLSQNDLSRIIGISRQTYSSIETKKRKMSWGTYLSLVLFFENNEKTRNLVEAMGVFPKKLEQVLNVDREVTE